jgi:hypothetical protein
MFVRAIAALFCIVALALFGSVALAQTSAVPKSVPGPKQKAMGQTRIEQPRVLNISDLAYDNLTCGPALNPLTAKVQAIATLSPTQIASLKGANPRVEVFVNGATQGSALYTLDSHGNIRIAHPVRLPASGPFRVQFAAAGARSANLPFAPSCARLVPGTAATPGTITLPDIGVGDMVIFSHSPPTIRRAAWDAPARLLPALESRVSLGDRSVGLSPLDLIHTDFNAPVELYRILRAPGGGPAPCQTESDAQVTIRLWFAVRRASVGLGPYLNEGRFKDSYLPDEPFAVALPPIYIDTRFGSPEPTAGRIKVPEGREFLIFDRVLQCTRNGTLEIHLDPDNRLTESNERNNVLRLRYATTPPAR